MTASHSNEEKNTPINKENFSISRNILPYAYISSIPDNLNLATSWESIKGRTKGYSSGFILYHNNYYYVTAHFNLNDSKIDYNTFLFRIETMFATLQFLNNGKIITASKMYLILKYIQNFSNYNFDLKEVYFKIKSFHFNHNLVEIKQRNYKTIQEELSPFKKPIEFLNAFNEAQKIINYNYNLKELFYLIEERITNDDYGYIHDTNIIGLKKHNLLVYAIIRKFNFLCTGKQRKGNILKHIKSEPLYNSINSVTLKAMSLKPQLQNAFVKKQITNYEKELKKLNQFIKNRLIAHQLLFILSELTDLNHQLKISLNVQVRDELKTEFVNAISKKVNLNPVDGAKEFDSIYKNKLRNKIPHVTVLSDIFDRVTLEQVKVKGKASR